MADPICRWRNSSVKQLIEFNSIFPLAPTEKQQARELVEQNWQVFGGNNFFTTPYQLAAQMGVYYETDSILYPRFRKFITINEACEYMQYWGRKYYAPNPYTKSIQQEKSVVINNFLVNWAIDKGQSAFFTDALKVMFSAEIGNTDILINMLNNFSEVQVIDNIVSLKIKSTVKYEDSEVWLDVDSNDKEAFFKFISKDKYNHNSSTPTSLPTQPLQQIFYGAPGTGKSHTIKKTTENVDSKFVIRTTFHPDSDYSTFVGAYKPKMEVMPRYNPQTGEQMGVEKRIVYAYTPQAFLKAYTTAWHNPEQAVYLIIEEINRGNCAQIFGDLFQLLDRVDNGQSCYPIKADQDIQMYLMETFADDDSLPENIRSGEELVLPANLYIWATMNTSDQSLFPIDSAFKRRWEWKYIPITQGKDKETGNLLQWSIEAEGTKYDWWSFLEVMNKCVGDTTSSEDKKLGFFFCKADGAGIISADKFVGKVLFYLWNDVFKDYPDNPIAANLKEEGAEFTYGDFYTTDNSGEVVVREELVTKLLEALGVKVVETIDNGQLTIDNEEEESEDTAVIGESAPSNSKKRLVVKFPDGTIATGRTQFDTYFNALEKIGFDKVEAIASMKRYTRLDCPLISKIQYEAILNNTQGFSYVKADDYFVIKGIIVTTMKDFIVHISEELGLGIDCFIER